MRYGVPFVSVEDDTAAALLVERWVWLVCREIVSQANDLARGSGAALELDDRHGQSGQRPRPPRRWRHPSGLLSRTAR